MPQRVVILPILTHAHESARSFCFLRFGVRFATYCLVAVLLNALSISTALANETLFYIVKKADWLNYSTRSTYRPASFARDGFIALATPEQVPSTARALCLAGGSELLLLKINVSSTDPRLKWETAPNSEVSLPYYYGELPRNLIKKIYPLAPQRDGHFALPADPFLKRMMGHIIPNSLVDRFLSYHHWQNPDRFHKLQTDNFMRPKVRLQWWYFDFFLQDGSSVVLAFIPQHWWEEPNSATEKKALFTMSLKTKQGVVKRFSALVPQSKLKTSADHLEIPSHFVIRTAGSNEDRSYSIQVNFPEVNATFLIKPTQPPFAAYPTGVMPGVLQTVLSGAPVGAPSFSYVSQIPTSTVSGSIAWDEYQADISGQAYHEQGRLNDTPARQGTNWYWYHFSGAGWTIFGTPGSYIYLQEGNRIVRSGFHLITQNYTLRNRAYSSPEHAKILTGGEIDFHHNDLAFRLTISPLTAKTLVFFPSTDPNQVWGTVEGAATLSISEGSTTRIINGRMFLETCSWETSDGRKN